MAEIATLAGGCFWCVEAVFQRIKGVKNVVSGYAGGGVENPSYEQVTSGKTGHVEAIQITFDPEVVSFEKILDVFWATHDPTSENRQDYDVGEMYRSVIFYHDEKQKKLAEVSKRVAQAKFKEPIVTEIVPFASFYKAEDYHQDFYKNHRGSMYCQVVIDPKIQKLYREFGDSVKEE